MRAIHRASIASLRLALRLQQGWAAHPASRQPLAPPATPPRGSGGGATAAQSQRPACPSRSVTAQRTARANASAADDELEAKELEDGELSEDLDNELACHHDIATGGLPWAEAALTVAQLLLKGQETEFSLFSLRARSNRLDIRLDKLTDQYGSPSLDDITAFGRRFNEAFVAAVGEDAGDVEVEISSPGAERRVRVPDELQRFAALPMTVESCTEEDKVVTRVLAFVELDASAGTTRWRLANVRVNRRSGRGLSVRQRKETFDIPLTALRRVNLHLDC